MSLQSIRRKIKEQRLALPEHERAHLSSQITHHFRQLSCLLNSHDIAIYYPMNGEVDTTEIIHFIWHTRNHCFLPIIQPLHQQSLLFAPYTARSELSNNKFGIPEPHAPQRLLRHAWSLDMIVMPLVAFDNRGNRIGMGAGYYDRTLANRLTHTKLNTTKLIGLAYEFQKVKHIKPESWDVPLDIVVTEKEIYEF